MHDIMGDRPSRLVILGRSSSHFTRVTRIFAGELGVEHEFRVLFDLTSTDPADYAGNPALKIPVLVTQKGSCYGALNACRELARRSSENRLVVWPEALPDALACNAQELVLHAMSTEVILIMAKMTGGAASVPAKALRSLENTMAWLEGNASDVLGSLPEPRHLSFLEVSLYCLVTHLEFREVLSTESYPALREFAERFGTRASARVTAYCFDR